MFPFNNLEDDTDFISIATGSIQFSKCLKPSSDLCFKSVDSLYTIPKYSFITRSCTSSAGGGVGLYIHNDYA